ncbi:glycosyltransferase family 2 protein [Curvivirga sp.]|uniref:glycosyltransferase family 2 protein n=1 Tax=Curvivirga sp. TaxID=2856848 RepID=UPI003B5CE239
MTDMNIFNPCILVPSYNHSKVIEQVVSDLGESGLPVFVIDDGSDEPHAGVIAKLHAPDNNVYCFRLTKNAGKGAAVCKGFHEAFQQGYTHAVQVDADGQHDLDAIQLLINTAKANPKAVVSGNPVYDDSMPMSRKIGRWITHIWVWIETLSFEIRDSMCGFRVYPIQSCIKLIETRRIGLRMNFDPEIMVRLYWRGVPVRMVPVKVIYPEGNTSNFKVWRDNWQISKMHTKLFFGMLFRFPILIARKFK